MTNIVFVFSFFNSNFSSHASCFQLVCPVSVPALGDNNAFRDQFIQIVSGTRRFQANIIRNRGGFVFCMIGKILNDRFFHFYIYRRFFIADFYRRFFIADFFFFFKRKRQRRSLRLKLFRDLRRCPAFFTPDAENIRNTPCPPAFSRASAPPRPSGWQTASGQTLWPLSRRSRSGFRPSRASPPGGPWSCLPPSGS